MKLRIRHDKKTKVLNISDDKQLTFQDLRLKIKETLQDDLGISSDAEFQISLDGKKSAGEDSTLIKDAGVVSGDLLKIIYGGGAPTPHNSTANVAGPSRISGNTSTISESSDPGLGSSSSTENASVSIAIDDIPCHSPGPIFFQDCGTTSGVPHLLQKMYENDSIKTQFQAICAPLHIMMCESGFYVEGHAGQEDIVPLMHANIFVAEYKHPAGHHLKFTITCNPLGTFVLINGVAQPCQNTSEQVLTLQIKTSEYVEKFNASNKNNNAAAVYKNLSKLSRIFKETISYPALNNMREELQLPPVHGILSLFPELLLRICSNLDCKSLSALSQVCKSLSMVTNDETLWRNLYINDFKSHPSSVGSSWKEMYARKFKREKEFRREMERRYRDHQVIDPWPQFPTPGHPGPVPFPEQPFGMIGGEHDLHPAYPHGPFANQPRMPRRFPPNNPVHPNNPDNPLPGSRFDPIYPGGNFRPGRGGGMMDMDMDDFGGPGLFPRRNQGGPGRRNMNRYGFM